MTPDEYVRSIISQHSLPLTPDLGMATAKFAIEPIIKEWAAQYLVAFDYSGSIAKGTGVKGTTDVDFFISLHPTTPQPLGEIYENLCKFLVSKGYVVRKQNVSVGTTVNGLSVDLVPGKKQSAYSSDHSLYRRKANTWTQTNVATHIRTVSQSQRLDEIRAIKIWRKLHNLDFPSFYLEMTVINALSGKWTGQPSANVWEVFTYLSKSFVNAVVIDPANSNNRLSDDLTTSEKTLVANAASNALKAANWNQIIW
jgi:hypothetical protein